MPANPYAMMDTMPHELGSALFVTHVLMAGLIQQGAVKAGPLLEHMLKTAAGLPPQFRETIAGQSLTLMIQLLEDSAFPKDA